MAKKRDFMLWRLILQQMRDGQEPPELANYDEPTIVYNSALLINAGYIDGSVIQNGTGDYAGTTMINLTNEGHDLLDKLESEQSGSGPKEAPMVQKVQQPLAVFISHSGKDEKLAAALVELLRSALNIPAEQIRCTSVNGYRLPHGAETEDRLREEVHNAKAFIGLITPSSIASAYVMFELGARWGARLHLAPLLGAGADSTYLRGPLSSLNALNCNDAAQVHQMVDDLARVLDVTERTSPAAYQRHIDQLVELSKAGKPTSQSSMAVESVPEEDFPDLEPNEIAALKLFVELEGDTATHELVAERLGIHPLKADRLLDRLAARVFIENAEHFGMPTEFYRLAPDGRDYLIDHGFIK